MSCLSRICNVAVGVLNAAAVACARCFLTDPVVVQMAVIVDYLDARRR